MQKSLEDKARDANDEIKSKIDESIEKGIYAFRAQMVHYNNTELLEEGKFDPVIANTDLITGIINREQALTLMDEIQTLLANNKNFIKAATENLVDVTTVKERVLGIEDELQDGNMYKAKRELTETLEDLDDVRKDYIIGWSRYTIIELNEKMDEILDKYKEFPKQFFHFQENPVHILTSFLEDIMTSTRDEEYDDLENLVDRFYLFYFQIERFLREEQKIREAQGGEVPREIPKIEPGMELSNEVSQEDVPQTEPEERIKDLFAELKEIDDVSKDGLVTDDVDEDDLELDGEMEPEESSKEDFEAEGIATPDYSLPDDVDEKSELDEETTPDSEEEPTKADIKASFSMVTEVIDKLKDEKDKEEASDEEKEEIKEKKNNRKEAREKNKIKTLVKTPEKTEGKKLPSFKSANEDEVPVKKPKSDKPVETLEDDPTPDTIEFKKTDPDEEGCKVVDIITGEEKEECVEEEEEVDEETRLKELSALAFKHYLNKEFDVAIEFYDKILAIDPEYKDSYEKRDECYLKILEKMKSQYIKSNKPAKTIKKVSRKGKKVRKGKKKHKKK